MRSRVMEEDKDGARRWGDGADYMYEEDDEFVYVDESLSGSVPAGLAGALRSASGAAAGARNRRRRHEGAAPDGPWRNTRARATAAASADWSVAAREAEQHVHFGRQQQTMNNIAEDVLAIVMRFLSYREAIAISIVCKAFTAVVREKPALSPLPGETHITVWGNRMPPPNWLMRGVRGSLNVVISPSSFWPDDMPWVDRLDVRLVDETIANRAPRLSRLKSLTIATFDAGASHVRFLASLHAKLDELEVPDLAALGYVAPHTDATGVRHLSNMPCLTELKTLKIHNWGTTDAAFVAEHAATLRCIVLCGSADAPGIENWVTFYCTANPRLTSVVPDRLPRISGLPWPVAPPMGPAAVGPFDLRILDIRYAAGQQWEMLIPRCRQLEVVEVGNDVACSDETMASLSDLEMLRVLRIGNVPSMTAFDAVQGGAAAWRRLETLEINYVAAGELPSFRANAALVGHLRVQPFQALRELYDHRKEAAHRIPRGVIPVGDTLPDTLRAYLNRMPRGLRVLELPYAAEDRYATRALFNHTAAACNGVCAAVRTICPSLVSIMGSNEYYLGPDHRAYTIHAPPGNARV
jgi:hypothetical protein